MKLPLVVQKSLGCSWLEDAEFNHVADYLTIENAQIIAHRVNVHDELVAALDALFENCSMVHNRWGDGCNGVEASAAIKNARAALERAKQ